MKLEIATPIYNERRYGKPWIAKVIFIDGKSVFHFGQWIGQEGRVGLLTLEINIGDIVARGQKDFRKPSNSAPNYYVVEDNGDLTTISKVEAYRRYITTKDDEIAE